MLTQRRSQRSPANVCALTIIALLAGHRIVAAAVTVANGEPDPNCPDLRLWLRADAGIRDSADRSPTDPKFNGSVSIWADQSTRHFDLGAKPEHAPWYVARQSGAGGQPTVAFGGGRMLARLKDSLHEHVNSTTLLVLQIQRGRDQGNVVFCAGDPGGKRESLGFEHPQEADPMLGYLRWWTATQGGATNVEDTVHIPADGRFAVVIIRSAGENSSVEIRDGLGDALGASREVIPRGNIALSNQCGPGYCLGGTKLDQPLSAYDGQIAEVMVYNRALTSAERYSLVGHLRRKYALDVLDAFYPAGTFLMQAEDFDSPWQLNPRWDSLATMCLGRRHVTCEGPNKEGLKRTVLISRPGNYSVWVRAIGMERQSGLRTTVAGKSLSVTHNRGPMTLRWQLAGTVDLPPGEAEIVVRGEGPGRKECDAVLLSTTATTLAAVEENCALARRLRQVPSPGRVAAVFDDGRRIEGSLVTGWRGNGIQIGRDASSRPGVRCLVLDHATDVTRPSDALLEFHNGDRIYGTICGYAAPATKAGRSAATGVLFQPSQDLSKAAGKPIGIDPDWLRRIVFDPSGPPRHCPPRSLVCRDGRVIAFRALRFNGEGASLLADQGLIRLGFRDLAEVAMQPVEAWEAYHRQLAQINPQGDQDIVRLETGQGMILTATATGVAAFRAEAEAAASTCRVHPAWSSSPIPVAWSAVRTFWRAPAHIVPLSHFRPQQVTQQGALGSSWKWQADRNVAGGELRSGGLGYFWGFGVHAPNTLTFRLPDSARAFQSGLGIDATMGDAGCVTARVFLDGPSGAPVFQSDPVLGSRMAISTGAIGLIRGSSPAHHLILAVDSGARASGANPLDIGDHANWLEPTLFLDPAKLHAAVEKYRAGVK
jgi:hypothetical protein